MDWAGGWHADNRLLAVSPRASQRRSRGCCGDRLYPVRTIRVAVGRTAIFEFIEGRYSVHRLHGTLDCLSPADCEPPHAA